MGSGCERLFHPIARSAFFGATEAHSLDLEFSADQLIQVHSDCKPVAAEHGRRSIIYGQFVTNHLVGFLGKKGHLTFVVFPVVEKTISSQTAPGDTVHLRNLPDRMSCRGLAMTSEETMSLCEVKPLHVHALGRADSFEGFHGMLWVGWFAEPPADSPFRVIGGRMRNG